MKKQKQIKTRVIRFHRFCRGAYAAFNSMHRVVNIGRLATYIADRQLQKSAIAMALCAPVLCNVAFAQTDDQLDEHMLPTLTITAAADSTQGSPDAVAVISRSQLQGLAVSSVGELLEQLPGVDLRTRGAGDVQGDLTMRGGTFDQMLVLLNGVNLTDPQTGHHNLDIPIDLAMVDRVEIIPSAALAHYGLTSFCGAVNIVTGQASQSQAQGSLSLGSFGQRHLSMATSLVSGPWTYTAAAAYHHSDGYRTNTDYSHGSLFLQAHRHDSHGDWNLQLGGQIKDFGSQAFYSTRYPDQFEATRTLVASASHQRNWQGWQLEAMAYGRLHKDRFELFREGVTAAPTWYAGHNYHLSATAGMRLRTSRCWVGGQTTVGASMRSESILSNVLGDSLSSPVAVAFEPQGHYYILGTTRTTVNTFAEHSILLGKAKISASALGSYNTMMGPNYGYAVSAQYPWGRYWRLGANMGRSFRIPTFNDRYYQSATQVCNPDIESEYSHQAEMWATYRRHHFRANASLYGRVGNNIIDWIRTPESTVWYSTNHAAISALGGDMQLAYTASSWLRRVGVGYSYCALSQQADGYISNYALDYLRHKVGTDLVLSPMPGLRLKLLADYHYRQGSYTDAYGIQQRYEPVFLLNAAAEYDFWHLTIFAEGYNLLNRTYCDYGGIPQPGISFLAGVRVRL